MSKLLDLVSPLQGTDSAQDFSRGNTLPLVCTPWPMTAWTLQTGAGRWAYRWRDAKIQGIRATHQPSPWMGDHGHFTLLPQTGERLMEAPERAAGYRREDLVVRPDYLAVSLLRYGCRVELVPTERCCKMRFHFGAARRGRLVVDCFDSPGALKTGHDGRLLFGSSSANDGGVPDNFRLTFCLRLSVAVKALHGSPSRSSGESGFLGAIEFEIPPGGVVECDVSTSYLGEGQAALNLEREIGSRSFEEIRANAAAQWESLLSRIEISTPSEQARRTFYSCFYRTLTFPQTMHEVDAEGKTVHYSPYTGNQRSGVLYAGHGFWDCYRTVYPLYSLLFPEKYADILRGWMNACQEGGWYPRWPSPGYRVCMLSTQADVVFADAAVKGLGGFDLAEAYEGLRRNAFEHVDIDAGYGRPGLRDYVHYGFLPADHYRQSVAATLDNAHCDYCLSQIARKLGKKKDASELLRRSRFFANLFDPGVGFMRPKNSDGSWVEPFLEFQWGGAYVEGGAWQTSWGVPHDPTGLIHLHGGNKKFLARLNRMFTTPPHFTTGSYLSEIHEMTEMAMAPFGQYAHSNQPVHHVLYLFDEAGAPHLTDHWVYRILNEYYSPDPGGFPGDEDNGEMSAWFLLSALGIFPLCPGKPGYKLVTPIFEHATVRLPSGERLEITPGIMPTDAGESCHVVNGQMMHGRDIEHAKLMAGGTLQIPPAVCPQAPARSVKNHANIGLPSSDNLSGRLGPSSGGPGDQAQNQPQAAGGRDDHAFSLVEILVVVAIIAVLAALAVPVVTTAMAKGRDARCAANLKTLSVAIFSYCSDNNGIFPNPVAPVGGSIEDHWHRQITVYLGETNFASFTGRSKMANVFLCPNDPAPYFGKLSYGLNSQVRFKRLPNVTQSTAVLLADSSEPSLLETRVRTNHGENIQFSRVDGSLGVATNLGTAASHPELWLITR